jgi:pyruvate formate lyase activating enzyme
MAASRAITPLQRLLESETAPSDSALSQPLENGALRCVACGHRCYLPLGKVGICKVRFNRDGVLRVPRGYVAALQCDPVEKKPFFHVRPGALALSFGMLGCDYHCAYCQNWITSQAIRDPHAGSDVRRMTPEGLVELAMAHGAEIITSTYNEPLITSEWGVEVFRCARARGLLTSYVSNGNGTPEVLDYIQPWVDLYKVDLKSFNDREYRKLGGVLANVLDTIRSLVARGIWVEIVTLFVPGLNDSDREMQQIAEFLASVSLDIPWHVTAFHPDYKMTDREATGAATLLRAYAHGRAAGLRYVYAGNLPGRVGEREHTRCPACGHVVVERVGFRILRIDLVAGGCAACGAAIPGRWGNTQRASRSTGRPIVLG